MSSDHDMFQWYQDYYTTVENSVTYSKYCKEVFGEDLSQQGFSDMKQITAMLNLLHIKPDSSLLDIGCGNGKLIEYISDTKKAIGYGFDYSSTAIHNAQIRTHEKRSRLTYEVGKIGIKQYQGEQFDVVISIDTIYFAEDICQTLQDIYHWLKPGGKMAIFYSAFRFNDNEPIEKMQQEGTDLAKAFNTVGIKYTAYDFTENHYNIMKMKKRIASKLKSEFEAEDSMILYNNAITESINDNIDLDSFIKFSTRYLYIAEK